MSALKQWYKVVVDPQGVKSVEVVQSRGENGARVFYVQATDKTEAAVLGKELFRSYMREKEQALRDNRQSNGLCRACGRGVVKGKSCESCKEKDRRKYHKKARGEAPMSREESLRLAQEGRKLEKVRIRLATLKEVRETFNSKTREGFLEWLNNEINKGVK